MSERCSEMENGEDKKDGRMIFERQPGVPRFISIGYGEKTMHYAVLIPVINEGDRLIKELKRAHRYHIADHADIVICDGGSTDGSTDGGRLKKLKVNTLLIKQDDGGQGAQLRMGIWWALQRGYDGIITIDGNDKDSIEDIPRFIKKLQEGYDMVQGSRFIKGGRAIHTPILRLLSIRLIHAPIISLTAHHWYTDTTNAFRAYSRCYLEDERVEPLRDIFMTYELLAYLSVRATQLGYKVCEIPVTRFYPRKGRIPTKISFFKGNGVLLSILIKNLFGVYAPIEKG